MERRSVITMSKLGLLLLCTCLLVGGMSHNAHAWFWNKSLVTINGESFAEQDYRDWWQNWQEPNMPLPTSLDDFINWQLMAQEGQRMQLDLEANYQRKLDTFLKVRSLMIFKNQEVDSKIQVNPAALWKIYVEEYCPRWQVGVFFFESKENAAEKGEYLRQGTLSIEELKAIPSKEGGPLFSEAKWLRRPQIKEDWISVLRDKEVGHITAPTPMGHFFIILHFMEEKGPQQDDFSTVQSFIETKVRKQQSAELTEKLVAKLQLQYQVVVDQEFLATIGDTPLNQEHSARPVITTNKENFSAGALQVMIAKERQFRKQYNFQPEDAAALKKRVVASMLAQTLVSWEAMARHYEKKEPFKSTYEFYHRHRLTKEIEKRFIRPKSQLEEAEILVYYENNQHLYSHPEIINFILVEGEEELINRMRLEITQGDDFSFVVKKHFPSGLSVQQLPINHIEGELKAPLLALSKGEVSQPFTMQRNAAMVKLVSRRSAVPVPFEQIKDELAQKLSEEKFNTTRAQFLSILKNKSTIKVNSKKWTKLQQELAQQHESKETK